MANKNSGSRRNHSTQIDARYAKFLALLQGGVKSFGAKYKNFSILGLLKLCPRCNRNLFITCFYPIRGGENVGSFCKDCESNQISRTPAAPTSGKERIRSSMRAYNQELRAMVLSAYGNQCSCCGESEAKFLGIDHIFGGGKKHRTSLKTKGGHTFYRWLREQGFPKDRFQLLCHNCNLAKGFYGECPHKLDTKTLIRGMAC